MDKMNKITENLLLIVNISQVGGWKTKPWRAIMKRGKGPSPERKGSHTTWKHRQAQTSMAKHRSWKAAGKATLFVWILARPGTSLRETGKDAGVWGLTPLWPKRERLQAQVKHKESKGWARKRCTNALPLSSSQGLPSFSQVMQLCTALHQVSVGKTPELFGSILLPTQITGEKSRHWAPLLRTQLIFILLCLSSCVKSHKCSTWASQSSRYLRRHWVRWHPKRHFQTNIMSSYTNTSLSHLY